MYKQLWVLLLLLVRCGTCRMVEKNGYPEVEEAGKKGYHWKTGNWGICFSGKGPNSCGQGTRERQVVCVDDDERTSPEFLCDGKREPERSRNCFTACRHHKDKLKWEVGNWGPCQEGDGKFDLPYGGALPSLPAEELDPTEHYGLMQRNVSCILVSHDDMKLRLVVDEENCFTIARKPDPVRLCNIPRPQDCVVTEFMDWSPCRGCLANANQTRIRNVLVAPKNGGKPCPELAESRPCTEQSECQQWRSFGKSKNEFRLKISAWSKCEVPNSFASAEEADFRFGMQPDNSLGLSMLDVSMSAESSEKQTIFQAQVGYQTREVTCKDSKGSVVDLSLCDVKVESLPPRLRSCIVPQDCVVTEWSAWMKLEEGCAEVSGAVRPEIHERKRQVIRLPEGNGQPCPHLVERKDTSNKEALPLCKHKYKRIPSKWSECMVTSGAEPVKVGCGGGIQLRTISCVSVSTGQPVEDVYCSLIDDGEELPTVQRCEVACPRDCAVGEWGKWGPCLRESCLKNSTSATGAYRIRKRSILTQPSPKGLACPAVEEVQPCSEVHCYRWYPGHWGTCALNSPDECGVGLRRRSVRCVDAAKAIVEDSLCDYQEKPSGEEPCLVPCPFDCVLSPWSEWSPCSHPCSGQKMIALRQRNRTIIAPPGPGGHKCPSPDELMEMEPCNTHSCHGYSWLVLPWQRCTSEEPTDIRKKYRDPELLEEFLAKDSDTENDVDGKKICGTGIRRREVWCVENNNIRVADSKCHPLEKPRLSESCVKECPIDCQVSPWAEWSACPQECVPDASNEVRDGEVAPTQTRSRVILKNPTSGGMSCPHLDEFRPCPLSAARCKHYQWQLSEWSECQLPANLKCGDGFRTRGVWCSKNQRTTKVSPTFCVENAGPPPVLSERCTVDCLRHCILTQWSPWSKCSSSCRGEISRTRQLIGHSNSRAICLNNEFYPLRESKTCPCQLYRTLSDGEWSACLLEHPLEKIYANGRLAHETCGSGTRFKRNICVDTAGQIVEPSFCELDSSLLEEPCLVPCPVDCVQSEWSAWGECSSLCGPGLQNRTREVVQEPREGGRPCGANFEVKICNTPCANYRWASTGYTQCSLKSRDEHRECGMGNQYRTVRCLDYSQSGITTQVRNEYCDPVNRPEEVSECQISCPGDCVVSSWSAWSDCDELCTSSKQRQRTRVLLRSPSQGQSSKDCPHLIQVQNCQINVTCFTYEWKATTYGSCLPLGGSPCGEGIQARAVYCQRSDGRFVADELCNPKTKPAAVEKWCYLGCPVDCELTPWSKWNATECKCGNSTGFLYRYRKIVTSPSSSGRPCPQSLEQKRPCPVEPCYKWKRGPWSSCILEGAACGHGTSYRNVSCLRGETPVNVEECFAHSRLGSNSKLNSIELIKMDLNTETNCYLPCHGDCEVSEWSMWSHCHRNCQNNPTGGYQTRSRAILKKSTAEGESCPGSLWETRPCNFGACLTFEWLIEDGNIICRRSDGVQVVGGCDEKRKPCLRNCSLIKNSRCVAGSCTCVDGHKPRGETDRLIECVATKEGVSINQKLAHPDTMTDSEEMLRSHLLYLPNDEFNIWMFAMIGIGCLFVVFVAVSFYLMCHNSNSSTQENGTQVLSASKP